MYAGGCRIRRICDCHNNQKNCSDDTKSVGPNGHRIATIQSSDPAKGPVKARVLIVPPPSIQMEQQEPSPNKTTKHARARTTGHGTVCIESIPAPCGKTNFIMWSVSNGIQRTTSYCYKSLVSSADSSFSTTLKTKMSYHRRSMWVLGMLYFKNKR